MINMNEQISMTSAKNTETTNNYNFLYNYDNLDSQELSEYTRAYLNSYMSAARPELSDFSKQFLNSNETNNFTTKPELSNITRAYLFSQNTSNEEKWIFILIISYIKIIFKFKLLYNKSNY